MTTLPKEITINDVKYIRADTVVNVVRTDIPFEVYPQDLPETMTYVKAVKAVEDLNRNHGTTDWRIPTLEELKLMYKNKDEIGTFCTKAASGSDYPDWYWSSTENRDNSSYVHVVRFSDGNESWFHKDDIRLSCRPVRLVAASAPTPAPPGD